jgi:hypothetical protein
MIWLIQLNVTPVESNTKVSIALRVELKISMRVFLVA